MARSGPPKPVVNKRKQLALKLSMLEFHGHYFQKVQNMTKTRPGGPGLLWAVSFSEEGRRVPVRERSDQA